MVSTTRRSFVAGCSAAVAAMSGARLSLAGFSEPGDHDVLVVVFLRGGADGLSIVAPSDGADRGLYESARPELAIPVSGDDKMLELDGRFGLHPAAAALHPLYQDGRLAVIHAAGLTLGTRSHFDAMEYMELGTPGSRSINTGWLARHLQSAELPSEILMPSLAVGSSQPTSLLGNRETVAMDDVDSFNIDAGPWQWRASQRTAMRRMYTRGASLVHRVGLQTLNAMDLIEAYTGDDYEPANGAEYPSGSFGREMQLIAQLVKLQMGLRVATVDLGGWDTHENQAYGVGGYFANLLRNLADGMAALYTDLDDSQSPNPASRLTIVVQSEFGRRLRENAERGTDHGHGNVMLVMGGTAIGGVHGQWPGLAHEALFDGADLEVTTDFRRVLSEILIRRLANKKLSEVFPGYSGYTPLGIVQGADLAPI